MTRPPLPSLESLKRQAKTLKKVEGCALSTAQRKIAQRYGFAEWNLLHRHHPETLAKKSASERATPEQMRQWFLDNHGEDTSTAFDVDVISFPTVDAYFALRQQFPAVPQDSIEEVAQALEEEGPWLSLKVKNAISWFEENHERAVMRTPYDSREGGYLYPLVDVLDAVGNNFPDLPDNELTQVVEAIEALDDAWVDADFFKALEEEALADIEKDV